MTAREMLNQFRLKTQLWFDQSLGAWFALRSTRSEMQKLAEPFAVSSSKPMPSMDKVKKRITRRETGSKKLNRMKKDQR
jgi:hypothetical protein